MKKRYLKALAAAVCLVILLLPGFAVGAEAPSTEAGSSFSVHYIDVGQADAALVECDGHYMLIDGGNRADSERIYTVLKKAGAEKLDIVVASHAHEDHIGGLPGAFSYAEAGLTLCPVQEYDSEVFETFREYAGKRGGGITVPEAGDKYELGSAVVEILGLNCAEGSNNSSIVLRIDYGETSFLFTGDAEREAELHLLDSGAELAAAVLKLGHHGSDTSSTYPFLRAVMPEYAVISVGEGNSYGHPEAGPISRLRDAGAQILRTDINGDIIISSDGAKLSVKTDRAADSDSLLIPGGESESLAVTAEKPEESAAPPEEERVWTGPGGSKYHREQNCSGMEAAEEISLEEAEHRGYTPCKKCW